MSKRRDPNSGFNSNESKAKKQEPNEYSVENLEYEIEAIKRERDNVPGNQLGMVDHLEKVLYKIDDILGRAIKLDEDEDVKMLLEELNNIKQEITISRNSWSRSLSGLNDDDDGGYNSNATVPASQGGGRRNTRRRSRKSKSRRNRKSRRR